MKQLILASQSPRRSKLLQECGFSFRVDTVNVSEIIKENISMEMAISDLAIQKSLAYRKVHKSLKSKDILVLTADTMVVYGDQALGKPRTIGQAFDYLSRLSGGSHQVMTALCLYDFATGEEVVQCVSTKIWFKVLSSDEIRQYISTGEPMDKAGAYAIQGLGGQFVERIEGSKSNVIGLPTEAFEQILTTKGWDVERNK